MKPNVGCIFLQHNLCDKCTRLADRQVDNLFWLGAGFFNLISDWNLLVFGQRRVMREKG